MKHSLIMFVGSLLFLFFAVNTSWSADISDNRPIASLSLGAEFSSGKYNSDTTTRILYMPLIVSWFPRERLDMSVELPFIYQTYAGLNSTDTATAKTVTKGWRFNQTTPTSASSTTLVTAPSVGNASVSGVGDIVLRAGYIPLFEKGFLPQVRTSVFAKIPTASASDGLGTGELDFGGGFDFSKWLGNLHLAEETIYNRYGGDKGSAANSLSYSATVGYQVTSSVQPMVVVKGETALSGTYDDLLEVRGRLLWNLSPTTSIDLFVSRGISKSSPDYGGGFAVIYSF